MRGVPEETEALQAVRQELASWLPPMPDLGFTIMQKPAHGAATGSAGASARHAAGVGAGGGGGAGRRRRRGDRQRAGALRQRRADRHDGLDDACGRGRRSPRRPVCRRSRRVTRTGGRRLRRSNRRCAARWRRAEADGDRRRRARADRVERRCRCRAAPRAVDDRCQRAASAPGARAAAHAVASATWNMQRRSDIDPHQPAFGALQARHVQDRGRPAGNDELAAPRLGAADSVSRVHEQDRIRPSCAAALVALPSVARRTDADAGARAAGSGGRCAPLDRGDLRRQIYVMEGALSRAVAFGAQRLNREIRRSCRR